jgi:tetratricopeptide (TPR) repeat protein
MRRATYILAVVLLVGLSGPARAADEKARAEARAHYEKATGAYALGRYADAAAEFEAAFALKPDPAILYNAAQAYRLAGKKERALELYRSYRRVFGRKAEHAADVEKHVGELEKAIESDRHASSAESTDLATFEGGTAPVGTPRPAPQVTPAPPTSSPPAAPPPATAAAPAASLVAQPAPVTRDDDTPIYKRWWFWAGAGAIVAGAIVTGVLLSGGGSTDCGAGVDYCANTGL